MVTPLQTRMGQVAHALSVLLVALALLPALASAHDEAAEPYHGDPRAALPDELVTQPVAAADTAAIEPATPAAVAGGGLPETWCGTERTTDDVANAQTPSSTPQFKLVYAYASDQPNRFATLDDRLQANASIISRFAADQSGARRTLRWDMGTSCGGTYADIQVVALPQPRSAYVSGGVPSFSAIRSAVTPFVSSQAGPRNWVVYLDGFYSSSTGIAGTAVQYGDDSAGATIHDSGRMMAQVYGPSSLPSSAYAWPSVMLHEMSHNLGAVQNSAPHSSGGGHCNDRYDVMCYADGGPQSAPYIACPRIDGEMNETWDCGGDDYFNPTPAPGSYLATHWNLFASAFMGSCTSELGVACGTTASESNPPVNTTPAAPGDWQIAAYEVTLAGTDAEGGVVGWNWQVDGGTVRTSRTATVGDDGTHTLSTRVRDVAGNWSAWRDETVKVDTAGPAVSLSCPSGWSAGPVTCSVTAEDAGSGAGSPSWTVDGAAAGSGPDVTIATGGTHTVAATATDGVGHAGSATAAAAVDLADPVASLSCTATSGTRSRCVVSASDADSGLTSIRLLRNGTSVGEVPPGASFEIAGPATLTVRAVDRAGRATTSTPVVLTGTTATPSPDGTGTRTTVPLRGNSGRKVGTVFVDVVNRDGRWIAVLTLSPHRLPAGSYRVRACVTGAGCATKRLTLRRAGRPKALTAEFRAPSASVRASVSLQKRSGRFLRSFARAAAIATRRR